MVKWIAETGRRYGVAFVLVGMIISAPTLAALITTIIYILYQPIDLFKLGIGSTALILGIAVTFLVWLLASFGCMSFATADGGRPSSFNNLQAELAILEARLHIVKSIKKMLCVQSEKMLNRLHL